MKQVELESLYEALVHAIDAVGPESSDLFLAKVALALGHALDDVPAAKAIIDECKTGLADDISTT